MALSQRKQQIRIKKKKIVIPSSEVQSGVQRRAGRRKSRSAGIFPGRSALPGLVQREFSSLERREHPCCLENRIDLPTVLEWIENQTFT